MEDLEVANKNAYFFKLNLIDKNNQMIDYHLLKEEVINIIENNSIDQNGYKSLDVTATDGEMHNIIDIFEYKSTRVFCRLSKQKPGNSFIGRDYSSYQKNDLVDSNDYENKGIEQYTFALINYSMGVLCIVSSQGAPNEKTFEKMFDKYSNESSVEIIPIPNEFGIETIYNGINPEILNLDIEVPLPDGSVLEGMFGWNPNDVIESIDQRNLKVSIKLRSDFRRGTVTNSSDEVRGIIDRIRDRCNFSFYKKAKMKAKIKSKKAREYSFFEENFSYPIDVPIYYIEDYKKVYYSVDELVEIYKKNIIMAFNESRGIVGTIIKREE